MTTAYYDTSYLFKLQWLESGSAEVRAHAAGMNSLYCSLHGRAEFVSAGHRKVREGAATLPQLQALLAQLHTDTAAGGLSACAVIVLLAITNKICCRPDRVGGWRRGRLWK